MGRAREVARPRTHPSARLVVFSAVLLFFGIVASRDALREDILLTIMPTAERAYEYGSRHFDAEKPGDYDIERATRLFARAAEIDPDHPYLNHQQARIAFLKGDFVNALIEIDREIELYGLEHPKAYYMRGLINGFLGRYADAAGDYETYLKTNSTSWAAINDYAWVLLKDRRYRDALVALDWGLMHSPENPWLHNGRATALFEVGRFEEAYAAAQEAAAHIDSVTEAAWLHAYPGNDPLIARDGVQVFRKAVDDNMHTIGLALGK